MMNNILTKIALRYRALYLDIRREDINNTSATTVPVMAFVARLKENGFCVNEELLHALNAVSADTIAEITRCIEEVMGINLNWAALVKGWDVPTGESYVDHLITWVANIMGGENAGLEGTTLPCGHFIPEGTFPIERYNGCPYCGTPFKTADFVYKGQGSKLKELRLFTDRDMKNVFTSLLTSATPLDATQKDTLEQLLREYQLPDNVTITMKETAMLVVKFLAKQGKADEASVLLKTPADVLRYLWYEKTGYVQIIEPKTLVAHAGKMYRHMWGPLDRSEDAAQEMKKKLMLKYDRKACLRAAKWLNATQLSAEQAGENMNPKTLSLLKERPGLFARCLFASMLRFGSDKVLTAFNEIADRLPARLLLSLGNAAESYFDPKETRLARPITGVTHKIEANKLLALYNDDTRKTMVADVMNIYKSSMLRRFSAQKTDAKTVYIDHALYNIPVSVGDRATTIQDTSCALMGTRFPIEGDTVRLFMQWGKGLPAQHLDMDLSCSISLPNDEVAECVYYNLTCTGAKHSGDIRSIPDMVGTAEYVELSLQELEEAQAKYITFTCNAYSCGSLSPNLVVGWMNSAYPMTVSEEKGVAYDPSCVQHMVRISEGNLTKGLVFGVLDVARREIIWLEMPFTAQTLRGANSESVEALLHKLEAKLSVGELIEMKAKAQNLTIVASAEEADEAWALNPADVTKLLYM